MGKEDPEAAEIVKASMEKTGCTFLTGLKFKSVSYVDKGKGHGSGINIVVDVVSTGKEETITVDEVLIATGRKPNVKGLNLEIAKVEYDERKGVHVNDYLQTSNSKIYAVGSHASLFLFFFFSFFSFAKLNKLKRGRMHALSIYAYGRCHGENCNSKCSFLWKE